MRDRLDAAGYVWHRWVLNYDAGKQNAVLSKLFGGLDAWRMGLGLIVVIVVLLSLYMFFLTRTPKPRSTLNRALVRLEQRLRKLGFARATTESPHAYFRRLADLRPEWRGHCEPLASLCERAIYNDEPAANEALEKRASLFFKTLNPR